MSSSKCHQTVIHVQSQPPRPDIDEILRPHLPGRYNSALEAAGVSIGGDPRDRYIPRPDSYSKPTTSSTLPHFSSSGRIANRFFAGQSGSQRRGNILAMQEPRTFSAPEPSELEFDLPAMADATKDVFWPLPDQYERKPVIENLPLRQDKRNEIETAQDILNDLESNGIPFSKGWKSPTNKASVMAETAAINNGASEACNPIGFGSFSRQETAAPQASRPSEMPTNSTSGAKSPEFEGGSATPPPISRSRRYVVNDFEEQITSLGSYVQRPATAPWAYVPEHMDEVASSAGSTERPPTALRVDNYSSARTMSPYSQVDRRGSSEDSQSPTSVEEDKLYKTPALDKIMDYEEAATFRSTDKAPNFSLRRKSNGKTETGQTRNESGLFIRNNDSGIGISDRTRSFRDPGPDSGQGSSDISQRSSRPSENANRPVDFFSQAIFQIVIHNPAISYQLLNYCKKQMCSENVEFLMKVEQYRTTVNHLAGDLAYIHKTFISNQSPHQVNVPGKLMGEVHSEMKATVTDILPSMESMFNQMRDKIEQLVFYDIYPRFVRDQMAMEAAKSLTRDRHKYQGLGDCFCFSSPLQADNPIVYASDGFVQVTGYDRAEVIPRNCRFLQGSQTDRSAVRRLKQAIMEERETVELLLNYKKNGAPFWNLLYMAPLCDETGQVVFFMGGQINCSSCIHTNTDVMRVLSASHEERTPNEMRQQGQTQTTSEKTMRKSLIKMLRGKQSPPPLPDLNTGMERKVVARMEGQDLKGQIKEFYSAYSRYIVIRADTFIVKFYSAGVMETLLSIDQTGAVGVTHSIVGQDIFHFFRRHQIGNHQQDVKTPVKKAIKSGYPISLGIRLQTRRSAVFRGDESFMSHWTPLKDEHGVERWVVVTLGTLMEPATI